MGERGQVTSVLDEIAVVRLERTEACAKCGVCTMGLTSSEMIVNAKNICNAKQNDWVNIELESADFLKAVLIMYGIPCIFFLVGIFLGYYASPFVGLADSRELTALIAGAVLTATAYLIIKANEEKFKKGNYVPVATEILEDE